MAIGPIIPGRPTTPAKKPTTTAKPNVQAAMAADKKATSKVIANKAASASQTKPMTGTSPTVKAVSTPAPITKVTTPISNFLLGENITSAMATGDFSKVTATDVGFAAAGLVAGPAGKVVSSAGKAVAGTNLFKGSVGAVKTPKNVPAYARVDTPPAPTAPKVPAPAKPAPQTNPPLGPSTPKPKEAPVTNPYGPTTPLQPKPSTPSRPSTPTPAAPKPGPKPTPTIPRPATTPAPSTPTGPTTKPMTPGTMPKPADTKPATSTLPSTGTSVPTSKRGNFLTGAGTVGDLATAADATVGTTPTTGVKRDVQMVMPPAAPPASRVTTQTSATTPRPSRTNVPKLPPIGTGAAELGAVQSNWQDYRR
jgi:hypothetical protein